MRKWIFSLLVLFFSASLLAAPIKKIIFFGDSLSDDGNLYRAFFHLIPKSPPYYQGRFSNGPTWAEQLTKLLYDKYYISSANYAYGGATAIFHMPTTSSFAPTLLPIEVDLYLLGNLLKNKRDTLFTIWIGANDYLYENDTPHPEVLTEKVVTSISDSIEKLIHFGAKQFLILNLPDLSKAPFAKLHNVVGPLDVLTTLHNKKLKARIDQLQKQYPDIRFIYFDTFSRFTDLVTNPEKYNKQYHVNIKNVTEGCWQGNVFYKGFATQNELTKTLHDALLQAQGDRAKLSQLAEASQQILSNPLLADVYQGITLYEQGMRPCENADEYVFWDNLHPSALVHAVLAKMISEEV